MSRVHSIAVALATVVMGLTTAFADSEDSGRPLSAVLTGAAELPGPGDPDGSGTAELTFNQGQGIVCWEIAWSDLSSVTAAHIHVGTNTQVGGVVVPLLPVAGGCVSVDGDLIKAIRQSPENYYVNVHTTDFPAGAIRGQLTK